MKKTIILFAIAASMPTFAQQNVYELTQVKAGKLTATKTNQFISLMTEKTYDKYIISVSGDGGYSHQFESDSPTLNISDLDLPYNGSYNYEIRSVKFVSDAQNTMNNGRSEDARGKVSIIDVQAGKFEANYGQIKAAQDIQEPRKNSFPNAEEEK
ncbi:hypothetical protein [Litorilituus lipolyticus]|uniref:Uncharacterized protein n=1 Tax=Litorilituus lipolyticus TaxID=2491017 RepID=A0A502L9Y2_9GAMM|nr:hypothetical protein [Litorilituus lipolyticus]TPH17057.1 hypothetical protein EPA86_05075 [Litorilituus lipolyticus]